jgi:ATP-binding cassette subfamily B protein
MLSISWESDRARTAFTLITATTQYVALPLRAVGLSILVDGSVSRQANEALLGVAIIVGLTAVSRLSAWTSFNLRMRLRENTQLFLDTRLMELIAGIPSVEHHESPAHLDAMEQLRAGRPYLANPFNPLSWTLASGVQTVMIMLLLAHVELLLALLPLFGVPAAKGTAEAERQWIRAVDSRAHENRALRYLMHVATDASSAKEVRLYDLGSELVERRRDVFREGEIQRVVLAKQRVTWMALGWLVFSTAYGVALVWAVGAATSGRITVGALALVVTLGAQMNAQLATLALNVAWLARAIHALNRLVWLEDYASDARAAVVPKDPVSPPEHLKQGIVLDSVGFTYPGGNRRILEDVNLVLPAGSIIALVGENGSGKSTLVKLLTRMYEPTSGQVLVDGVALTSMPVNAWRHHISAGIQDFGRYEFLARQTVGVGDVLVDPDDAAVKAALARASAPDLVSQLPSGLDSQLGVSFGGCDLSTGQWQKLALARAMMRPAPLLLILDEPTASLDAASEHATFERFTSAARAVASTKGAITLLISHRFSTVRMADLIVVLSGGRIVEKGSHSELMEAGGSYAALYRVQATFYR